MVLKTVGVLCAVAVLSFVMFLAFALQGEGGGGKEAGHIFAAWTLMALTRQKGDKKGEEGRGSSCLLSVGFACQTLS